MNEPLTTLYDELRFFLKPVVEAVTDRDALEFLLHRHGWNVELADDVYADVVAVSDLASSVETLVTELDRLDRDDTGDSPDLRALIDATGKVLTGFEAFPGTDLSRLPEPLTDPGVWSEFTTAVVEALIADYLAFRLPRLYATLVAIGVIETHAVEARPPFRREHQLHQLKWSAVSDFLGDPEGHLRRTYRWGDPEGFAHSRLLEALAGLCWAWGIEADLEVGVARASGARFDGETVRPLTTEPSLSVILGRLRDFDRSTFGSVGVDVIPVSPVDSHRVDGLLLGPVIDIEGRQLLDLTSLLRLTFTAGAEIGANAGLIVRPGEMRWNAALGVGTVQAALTSSDPVPRFLVGSAGTANLSISGVEVRTRIGHGDRDGHDVDIAIELQGTTGHRGLEVHVPLDHADGLVTGLVGSDRFDLGGAVELRWSSRNGFSFVAGGAIGFELPAAGRLGPIDILPGRAEISFASDSHDARGALRITAGIRADIGPIGLTATGLGLELVGRRIPVRSADGNRAPALLLGDIGLDLKFVPPSGAGLRLSGEVVSGGGFLEHDADRGRYAGTLQISLAGIQVAAVGVIDTRDRQGQDLPTPGYSIVIAMLSTFPPVQLGLGFTLRGIGGLVGIHRASDYDTLRAGLTSGSLDSILFPPAGTAPDRLLRDLGALFPVRSGRYVVGPMLLLSWGSPAIADIKVGVLLASGGPPRALLLGQLTIQFPPPDSGGRPFLLLKVDIVGELEPTAGSLALDATLRDSSLAGYALTGDMAARIRWEGDPTFAISFGGFHPDYSPEAEFPSLRRLALTISQGSSLRIVAESYLAVTSNTLQFGGRAELLARRSGFSVEGWLEFHTLFVLSPFSFSVAVGFDVSLRFKGRTFASVAMACELSGPSPWRAKGNLKVKIALVTFKLGFNISWGPDRALTAPPRSVWPELEAALSDLRNWVSVLPPASSRDVIVLPSGESDTVRVHPHGALEIRQSVAPLGIDLQRFGPSPPTGDNRFSLPLLELGGTTQAVTPIDELFAPAQFLELTEDQRLSRRSFEGMTAGIRVSSAETRDDPQARRSITVLYETDLVQPDTVARQAPRPGTAVGLSILSRAHRMSLGSRTRATTEAVSQFKLHKRAAAIAVSPERFTVAETETATTGSLTTRSLTQAEQAIERAVGSRQRSKLLVVAVGELQ
jgi:hypothetical protein